MYHLKMFTRLICLFDLAPPGQLDICSAFLDSELNEDMFIYLLKGHSHCKHVGKLNKAIYIWAKERTSLLV